MAAAPQRLGGPSCCVAPGGTRQAAPVLQRERVTQRAISIITGERLMAGPPSPPPP